MKEFSSPLPSRKSAACAEVERRGASLRALSLRIHANPELSWKEYKACAWLTEMLETEGFGVRRGVAGLETAFVAEYRGGEGPTLALMAEYDALPDLGHACGHNIIGTSSVAAAVALKAAWPDMPGRVIVVGCPAEETGCGKQYLIDDGVFDGVSAAMAVHPNIRTRVAPKLISMRSFEVEYFGKSAHASSQNHEAVNALDALVLGYMGVAALRQHIVQTARIHGIITKGGEAPNIIPDHAAGSFSARATDDEYLDELVDRALACFEAGARATGARFEYRFTSKRYSALTSNSTLVETYRSNMALLGIAETPPDPKLGMASSDVGNVSRVLPTIHPNLAIAGAGSTNHSPAFTEISRSEAGHVTLIQAAQLMAMTWIDLFERPALVEAARQEHEAGRTIP